MNKIKQIIQKTRNDSLIKGFSILFSGTVITQIVSLALAPILTRLYSPEEYGVNSVFMSILIIGGVVSTLRLQVPIAISNNELEVEGLSQLGIRISMILNLLLCILIFLFDEKINSILNFNSVIILWLLPGSIFLLSIYEIYYQKLLSRKKYKEMTNVTITKILLQGGFQIALAYASLGALGLVLGNFVSFVFTIFLMKYYLSDIKKFKYSLVDLKRIYRRNIDFPKYAFPAELASILSYSIIPIGITFLYSPEIAGFYALANRLIVVPIGVFGNSLRQVYLKEASIEYAESDTVIKSFKKTSKILFALAIPSSIILYLVSPTFFSLVFGDEWFESGEYVRLLILLFVARLVVGPLTATVNIINKQAVGLYVHLALLVSISFLILFSKSKGIQNPETFIWWLSTIYAIVYFGFYALIYYYVNRKLITK